MARERLELHSGVRVEAKSGGKNLGLGGGSDSRGLPWPKSEKGRDEGTVDLCITE
jgi:hypothetical protein